MATVSNRFRCSSRVLVALGGLLILLFTGGWNQVQASHYAGTDLTYTRILSEKLELNFKAKNLLNQMQETTQGGRDVNSYKEGTSASLGINYTF